MSDASWFMITLATLFMATLLFVTVFWIYTYNVLSIDGGIDRAVMKAESLQKVKFTPAQEIRVRDELIILQGTSLSAASYMVVKCVLAIVFLLLFFLNRKGKSTYVLSVLFMMLLSYELTTNIISSFFISASLSQRIGMAWGIFAMMLIPLYMSFLVILSSENTTRVTNCVFI
jgi:hypothetical protein